jgi:hypothetical protein
MIYVTAVPHPKALGMRRTIFVCYPCNRTWNYTLTPQMAEAYAPGDAHNVANSARIGRALRRGEPVALNR